ncbi:flavodoxin family protein [Methanocella sp. MCL-LM]|uniref:flavodoxin family protein n=1 Tax=Methanocella sp. MCL-LM TaxID=3412035 RepID=UPI003C749857
MKIWKIAVIAIVIVMVVVLAGVAAMAFIMFDVMSNTATGTEKLTPIGDVAGKALVVYDPGVTGTAKAAAGIVARELQAEGYVVDLAGVKSATAADVSGYDVIVVGGPTYAGNLSGSAKTYLENLKPSADVRIGIFATGSVEPESDDLAYMVQFVAGPSENIPQGIKVAMKLIQTDDTDKKCATFVTVLLQ